MDHSKKWYSVEEAAQEMGISIKTIYSHTTRKTPFGLMFVKPLAGKTRISSENLERAMRGEL